MKLSTAIVWLSLVGLLAACGGAAAPTATPTRGPAPTAQATASAAPIGGAATPTPTATARPAATAAPAPTQPQGKITVVSSSFLDERLDPHKMVGNQMQILYDNVYSLPVFQDAESKPVPQLAKSWQLSPDGRSFAFELRTDAKFHDGTPITADDVVYVYTRRTNPKVNPVYAISYPQSLDGVASPAPNTVEYKLKVPVNTFQGQLGFGMPQWYVLPKRYIESLDPKDPFAVDAFGERPLGSGPYKFVRRAIGEFIETEAVPNHWYQTPSVKTVVLRLVLEQATRVAMLKTGEADIVDGIAGIAAEDIKKTPGLTVFIGGPRPFGWLTFREFNKPGSPWADVKVRRALSHAVDMKAFADRVCLGQCQPVHSIGSPGAFGYEERPNPYPFDRARARQLLAEAGYPRGFESSIYHGTSAAVPLQPEWALFIANSWTEVGVRTKVIRMEPGAFYGCAQRQPACTDIHPVHSMTSIGSDDLGGGGYWSGTQSYYQAHDEVTDGLYQKARYEFDPKQREEYLKQLDRRVFDQALTCCRYSNSPVFGVGSRIAQWEQPKYYAYPTKMWTVKLKR